MLQVLSKSYLSLFGLVVVSVSIAAVPATAQQFEIVEPNGQVTSLAEFNRGRLVILNLAGERIDYERERRYDSTDGSYLGFFRFERNRVLRFPRSGFGAMYTADLNDPLPKFRATPQTVRPRESVAGVPPRPYPPRPQQPIPWQPGYPYPPEAPGYFPPGYVAPGYGGVYPGLPSLLPSPQSVLIDSQTRPNPPLEPVVVEFFNSGSRDLQVRLAGLAGGIQDQTLRLAPGESRPVRLQRDSGGERVDYFRVISPYGDTYTRETAVPIPPQTLYEVVVHEWAMQSIAIDRTGKSPNAIEDINYQGKGIGRFPLPAGPDLTSMKIDVRREARAAGNPGAVAPLVPEDPRDDIPSDAPLDRALRDVLEQQRRATGSR